jgi:hemerythrin
MTAPLVSFDFSVGVAEVDEAHRNIQREAERLRDLLAAEAPRGDVIGCFLQIRTLIVEHFKLEEKMFATLVQTAAGLQHVQRHRENHQVTTDALTYASDKLAAAGPDRPLPNIIPLIPQKYLAEMLTLDREMAQLWAAAHTTQP